MFENIKNIKVKESSSWQDKIFLTFDLDWCADEVLSYVLDIIEKYNVRCTFFITHETVLLERMKKNRNIELGLHPNLNPLLEGDFRYGDTIEKVIKYYKNILPEAESVRSHSLTQNSHYLKIINEYGFIFECNNCIPKNSKIVVYPYLHWDKKLIRVPHYWEDALQLISNDQWSKKDYLKYNGIKVFNFHPIHLFLNTENIERYEGTRHLHQTPAELAMHRYEGHGTLNILLDLLEQR